MYRIENKCSGLKKGASTYNEYLHRRVKHNVFNTRTLRLFVEHSVHDLMSHNQDKTMNRLQRVRTGKYRINQSNRTLLLDLSVMYTGRTLHRRQYI